MKKSMIETTIFILEDSISYQKKIYNTIKTFQENYHLIFDIEQVENPVNFSQKMENFSFSKTYIFFLDIDLKQYLTGIDIAKLLRSKFKNCYIVFITSFTDKMLDIINDQILPYGYIIKNEEDFDSLEDQILNTIKAIFQEISNQNHFEKIIQVSTKSQEFIIQIEDILYIESVPNNRNSVQIVKEGSVLIINKKLTHFKTLLQEYDNFLTNLKSYIINLSKITEVVRKDGSVKFINSDILYFNPKTIDKIKINISQMPIK
ncbi:putative two-component response-regulatory protein YehT [Listeria grayi]|uniref:LytTr DNA-binding domain protein n=1 Tax=Listeria grayi FSL F6-1183 TaxID=1265827 RepID=A0A829R7B8_LISGR|nr:LytTR family transcriptional regulator DNA-binding domain-containing protein [Listeria grayi]EUJ28745.1 LytTr DNA-binding domain protein [Listeria grayi FSL F6-1183]VEI36684.1 putative two-component response-regulatory protein YehT [Listeria grayi]